MLLTLSIPTLYPEDIVRQAAAKANAHARIKWGKPATPPHLPAECRFKLVEAHDGVPACESYKPASSAAHDVFIRALFVVDPRAIVRTAKAVYDGAKDFESQCANRVD